MSARRRTKAAVLTARWRAAGTRLRACDEPRFREILELAELVVKIHKDPMSVRFSDVKRTSLGQRGAPTPKQPSAKPRRVRR